MSSHPLLFFSVRVIGSMSGPSAEMPKSSLGLFFCLLLLSLLFCCCLFVFAAGVHTAAGGALAEFPTVMGINYNELDRSSHDMSCQVKSKYFIHPSLGN